MEGNSPISRKIKPAIKKESRFDFDSRGAASPISASGLIRNWNNSEEKKFHIDSQL
jgi:hypothetical protein